MLSLQAPSRRGPARIRWRSAWTPIPAVASLLFTFARAQAQTEPVNEMTLTLPYIVSAADVDSALSQRFFTEDGKFYFCRGRPCDDIGHDLYLERLSVRLNGPRVVLEAHLSGHLRHGIFRPGVSGDVTLSALPQLSGSSLVFSDPRADVQTDNALLLIASPILLARLEQAVDATSVDLMPIIVRVAGPFLPDDPLEVEGQCLALTSESIRVQALAPRPDFEGIEVSLEVTPAIIDEARCRIEGGPRNQSASASVRSQSSP